MTGGVIAGGREFVIAAYAVTATVLTVYAISVILRLREIQKRRAAGPR